MKARKLNSENYHEINLHLREVKAGENSITERTILLAAYYQKFKSYNPGFFKKLKESASKHEIKLFRSTVNDPEWQDYYAEKIKTKEKESALDFAFKGGYISFAQVSKRNGFNIIPELIQVFNSDSARWLVLGENLLMKQKGRLKLSPGTYEFPNRVISFLLYEFGYTKKLERKELKSKFNKRHVYLRTNAELYDITLFRNLAQRSNSERLRGLCLPKATNAIKDPDGFDKVLEQIKEIESGQLKFDKRGFTNFKKALDEAIAILNQLSIKGDTLQALRNRCNLFEGINGDFEPRGFI